FTSGLADDGAEELAEVGIVPYDHSRFLLGALLEQAAEVGEGRFGTQGSFDLQLAFVPHLVSDQRSGLSGALERAGNNDVHLRINGGQSAADIAALLNAFLIEGAFLVLLRIYEVFAGARVTQKINNHEELSYSSGEGFAFPLLDLRQRKRKEIGRAHV